MGNSAVGITGCRLRAAELAAEGLLLLQSQDLGMVKGGLFGGVYVRG